MYPKSSAWTDAKFFCSAKIVRRAVEDFKTDYTQSPETPRDNKAKKPGQTLVNQKLLKSALKLIDQAEKAARAKDTQAMLAALTKLREHLEPPT